MGEDCPNNYYVHFREWVNISYPQISEETWEHLIAEDLGVPYNDVMIDHEFQVKKVGHGNYIDDCCYSCCMNLKFLNPYLVIFDFIFTVIT